MESRCTNFLGTAETIPDFDPAKDSLLCGQRRRCDTCVALLANESHCYEHGLATCGCRRCALEKREEPELTPEACR